MKVQGYGHHPIKDINTESIEASKREKVDEHIRPKQEIEIFKYYCIALRHIAAFLAALILLTISGALIIQSLGYEPCHLCYRERLPYYVGMPIAAGLCATNSDSYLRFRKTGFLLLAITFFVSFILGVYHAGIEYGFWAGPSVCTGVSETPTNTDNFLLALQHATITPCDKPALKIAGLSLSMWNSLVSLFVTCLSTTTYVKLMGVRSK